MRKKAISERQEHALNELFVKYKYLTAQQTDALSLIINLDKEKIRRWFSAQRMKMKRTSKRGNVQNQSISSEKQTLFNQSNLTSNGESSEDSRDEALYTSIKMSDELFEPQYITLSMVKSFHIIKIASKKAEKTPVKKTSQEDLSNLVCKHYDSGVNLKMNASSYQTSTSSIENDSYNVMKSIDKKNILRYDRTLDEFTAKTDKFIFSDEE